MRENVFARLTQSMAFVAIGSFLILASDLTFKIMAVYFGIVFVAMGFTTAISATLERVPRWINTIETVASFALYVVCVTALIKMSVVNGIDENTALVIVLFIYVIIVPTIQAIRILKNQT